MQNIQVRTKLEVLKGSQSGEVSRGQGGVSDEGGFHIGTSLFQILKDAGSFAVPGKGREASEGRFIPQASCLPPGLQQ